MQHIARRQPQPAQPRRHLRGRQRAELGVYAQPDARDPLGREVQRPHDLVPDEIGIGKDMVRAAQPVPEPALEGGSPAGRVPLRVQERRQVVDRDDRRQVAGQRKIVRLVIEVRPIPGTGSAEAALQDAVASAAQPAGDAVAPRRPRQPFAGSPRRGTLSGGEDRAHAPEQGTGTHE